MHATGEVVLRMHVVICPPLFNQRDGNQPQLSLTAGNGAIVQDFRSFVFKPGRRLGSPRLSSAMLGGSGPKNRRARRGSDREIIHRFPTPKRLTRGAASALPTSARP